MKICVALDVKSTVEALGFVQLLQKDVDYFKVGPKLFLQGGSGLVEDILALGGDVFLDLKFYDIPSVVYSAVEQAALMGVSMLTVHATGGSQMLKAAVEGSKGAIQRPKVLAVTILTSMNLTALRHEMFMGDRTVNTLDAVNHFAMIADKAGVDGFVASGKETEYLRNCFGEMFLVTPGIRLNSIEGDDQVRTVTPASAVDAGSDCLVIGRPILQANEPVKLIKRIREECNVKECS